MASKHGSHVARPCVGAPQRMHSTSRGSTTFEIPFSLDFEALTREFPPPPDYFNATFRMSRDELRALQEKRFLATVARGWEIPFFRRHWGAAGLEPTDKTTTPEKMPTVSKP